MASVRELNAYPHHLETKTIYIPRKAIFIKHSERHGRPIERNRAEIMGRKRQEGSF